MTAAGSVRSAWFALQSRHRYEQRVVQELTAKGFEAFLPTLPEIHQRKDRRKTLKFPAFIGYLFARFAPTLHNRLQILGTNGVLKMLGARGIPEPVDPDQITSLQLALRSGVPCSRHAILSAGTPISINRGPLKGLKGAVARLAARLRIVINVTSVGQALAVEVALDGIEAVQTNSSLQTHEYLPSAWAIGSCLPQRSLALNAFGG